MPQLPHRFCLLALPHRQLLTRHQHTPHESVHIQRLLLCCRGRCTRLPSWRPVRAHDTTQASGEKRHAVHQLH